MVSKTVDFRLEKMGDELAPDSNVWRTYIAAAGSHDKDMVDSWNQSLDVLLIFVHHFTLWRIPVSDSFAF
jgi:hypothetical protein